MKSTLVNSFMKAFRNYLTKKYREDYHFGSIYTDEDTISYFSFTPNELKELKLKIAIVYNYPDDCFEIWLAAQNKQLQKKYWEAFKNSDWNKYNIPASIDNGFSIVDSQLISKPDFNNSEAIMEQIETKSIVFIKDILEVF